MLSKLKSDFDEILELVNRCPANLQEIAFKAILEQWFTANSIAASPQNQKQVTPGSGSAVIPTGVPDTVKPFLTANGVTSEMLGEAFHPTGPGAQLLASDIAGTGKATKQVNLAVLLSVRQALESGYFTCTLKELREMAVHYNCYDSTNFSSHLKSHKNYFKPREKGADLELSGPGLKKAGDLIKAIASAS
jgi:hypothetical protein